MKFAFVHIIFFSQSQGWRLLTNTHSIPHLQGITAREVIDFFFDKETRLEWEGTLESVEVVETLAEDSIIFHQLHKRVWPSTQRETLFCSHLCQLTNAPRPENMVGHTWMVCNFSLEHDKVPVCLFVLLFLAQLGMQ